VISFRQVRNQKTSYTPGWRTWEATGPDPTYYDELTAMLDRVRTWDLAGNEQWLIDAENAAIVLDANFRSARGTSAIRLEQRAEQLPPARQPAFSRVCLVSAGFEPRALQPGRTLSEQRSKPSNGDAARATLTGVRRLADSVSGYP
jgi:hypothetical protein